MKEKSKIKSLLLLALPLIAVGLAYLRVYSYEWAWDDYLLFIDSANLRKWPPNWADLAEPILPGTSYFRPLVLFSFVAEFKVLGLHPQWAHIVNFIIFEANVILVYFTALQIYILTGFRGHQRALLVAFCYGLHPAMIESVAWASGRFDLLCTFFSLTSILFGLRKKSFLSVSGYSICFFSALLCKEMAVTVPVVIFILLTTASGEVKFNLKLKDAVTVFSKNYDLWIATLIIGTIWIMLRYFFMGQVIHEDVGVLAIADRVSERLVLVLITVGFYLGCAIAPFSFLSPMHPIEFNDLTRVHYAVLSICVLFLLGALLLKVVKGSRHSLLLLAALGSLLPVVQIIPLTIAGSIGAERFLVFPLAFFIIWIFSIEIPFNINVKPAVQNYCFKLLLGGWLSLAAGCLYVTVPLWKSDLVLWSWCFQQHPESSFARSAFVGSALRANRYDLVKPIFEQMKERDGFDANIQLMYGNYLIRIGETQEGINYIEGALAIYPRPDIDTSAKLDVSRRNYVGYGLSTLALGYIEIGQYSKAYECAKSSLWYRPNASLPLYSEAMALYGMKRFSEASIVFDKVLGSAIGEERKLYVDERNKLLKKISA